MVREHISVQVHARSLGFAVMSAPEFADTHRPTTSSPARRSRSTCRRRASGVRLASGLVDVLATGALLLVVIFTFLVAALRTDGALAQVAFVGTLVVVFLVFPTTVETLSRGKSLGKWAFGLRTVRDDAGPISFQHAFVRALVGFVEIYATGARRRSSPRC